MTKKITIICGPTASGKSDFALKIAQKTNAVIINCDSKQLYQDIPIITAQPTKDEMALVPHKLYGVVPVTEDCSVSKWLDIALPIITKSREDNKHILLVGGTGLYIKALTEGINIIPDIPHKIRNEVRELLLELGNEEFFKLLKEQDPEIAQKLKIGDSQRITRAMEVLKATGKSLLYFQSQLKQKFFEEDEFNIFFLYNEREKLYENCTKRFLNMLENGAIEEAKYLRSLNLDKNLTVMKSHGVPELIAYLNNEITLPQATEIGIKNTRHYIKRQFTWFSHQIPNIKKINNADKNSSDLIINMLSSCA